MIEEDINEHMEALGELRNRMVDKYQIKQMLRNYSDVTSRISFENGIHTLHLYRYGKAIFSVADKSTSIIISELEQFIKMIL